MITQVFLYLLSLLELIWNCVNIQVTFEMIKKFITDLVSSKASGPECMLMMILQNFEAELSYILADLLNINLKASCFPD